MTRSTRRELYPATRTTLLFSMWRLHTLGRLEAVVRKNRTTDSTTQFLNGFMDMPGKQATEPTADRDAEIARMVREQGEAKALLDSGHPDQRGAQQWHDDALLEECCLWLERAVWCIQHQHDPEQFRTGLESRNA